MSKNYQKVCVTLKYIEQSNILVSAVSRYVLISAFSSLFSIPIDIASSAVGLKICGITVGIWKYKSIIKNKKKKAW